MGPADCIIIDKGILNSTHEATEALARIYQDQTPVLRGETARSWCFDLVNTRTIRQPRDPYLVGNLSRYLKTDMAHAAGFQSVSHVGVRRVRCSLTCDHSWALAQWSSWLSEHSASDSRPKPLLIHFDSHDDMGTPSVFITEQQGVFRSPVDDLDILDYCDPKTVSRFIQRGLIGIGSFIVPLQHALGGFDILHLVPTNGERPWTKVRSLNLIEEPTCWLGVNGLRPAVAIIDEPKHKSYKYVQSNDPAVIEDLDCDKPIFLDVDLDYFCNRYDSNEDGQSSATSAQVASAMDAVLRHLQRSAVSSAVEVLTFALSPDFFPSIHWKKALPWIEDVKQAIG